VLDYCLHVTLTQRFRTLAPGLTARSVLEKFAAVQMIDVRLPTTDGRELTLNRTVQLGIEDALPEDAKVLTRKELEADAWSFGLPKERSLHRIATTPPPDGSRRAASFLETGANEGRVYVRRSH